MKKTMFLIFALILLTGTASAVPFQVTGSSMDIDWSWGGGNVSYNDNAMTSPINLGLGESTDFTFGRLFFPQAFGAGSADISVQFSSPDFGTPVQDNASFFVFSKLFFSAGFLNFGNPVSFDYQFEGVPGIMTLDFADIYGLQFGNWVDITGTITNSAAPVPEPATLMLMGFGLIGLAGIARKKLRP